MQLTITINDPRLLELVKRDMTQVLTAYEHCSSDAHIKRGAQLAAASMTVKEVA